MNKKEKILAKLSEQRKGLKKVNLSMVSDLANAIETMKSYDVESAFDNAFTEYEYALGLMEEAKRSANKYIEASQKLDEVLNLNFEAYQDASRLYTEIVMQLDSLGLPESPQIENLNDELSNGFDKQQEIFNKEQNSFSRHNDLVDISDFN